MKKLYLFVFLAICSCDEKYPISKNCSLYVILQSDWEYTQGMSYKIIQDGVEKIPLTYFGSVDQGKKLLMIESKSGIVGFSYISEPNNIVILYDVNTGESWPFTRNNETHEQKQDKGRKLLNLLSVQQPNKLLKLGEHIDG